MKEFKESGLIFTFNEKWEVHQLDVEADYKNKICKQIPETRSIDFVGFNEMNKTLLFVEVKEFRGYGNKKNIDRLAGTNDNLTVEIAQKVRDSLATIIGGSRNSTNIGDIWKKYVNHLNEGKELKVIAWVELDVSTEVLLKRANVNISTRRNELRKRLKWLTSSVDIMNTHNYNNEVEGLSVNLIDR